MVKKTRKKPHSLITDAEIAVEHLEEVVTEPFPNPPRTTPDEVDGSKVSLALTGVDDFYQHPWEQLPDEPSTAYRHFLHYRDQGRARTFTAVASELGTKQPTISREAKLYDWSHRVAAWDNEQERIYLLRRGEAIRLMAETHVLQVQEAIGILRFPFMALQQKVEDDPGFLDALSERDTKELLKLASASARTLPSLLAAERLAQGMPTEIIGGMVEHQHTIEIGDDSLNEVIDTLARAGKLEPLPGSSDESEAGEIVDAEVVEFHPVPGSERADQPGDGSGGGGDE